MITQTPSQNKETPTKQREPLRWLIPAALLLLFLSICCIGQIVIVILSPRNEASNLNLLSKDTADYSPWKILLKFPPIAPGAAAAQAADRATEAAQALLSPTPQAVANAPTGEVIVIAAPQNAPTTTPVSALITPLPTVTPRPIALGPSATPEISTAPPADTSAPTLIASVPTETPLSTFTPTPVGGNQPTRTSTPVPSTATNTPKPPDTSTPTTIVRTPTKVPPPPDTNTPVLLPTSTDTPVPVADTNTPVPPPTSTDTPVPHNNTNTPVPPPTRTQTAVPPPSRTPTPVTPTPVTPTLTPVTPTASNTVPPATPTNTSTLTPVPATPTDTPTVTLTATQTNTPTATPTPSCGVGTGNSLRIAKIADTYATGTNQPVTYTICISNNTGAPVSIQDVQDTFPSAWSWVPFGNCGPSTATIGCVMPINNGGTVIWANPQAGNPPITIPNGQQLNLTVTGSYQSAAPNGQPWCNRYGNELIVNVLGNPVIQTDPVDACVMVQ